MIEPKQHKVLSSMLRLMAGTRQEKYKNKTFKKIKKNEKGDIL